MLFELRGDEPIDKIFLGYLETYRKHLARAIYHENKKEFPEADTHHGAAKLTEAVQRLIDRLVFMRVCEDRGIRQYGSLKQMLDRISAEGGEFYPALCAEFRQLDREYNGYLYKYHFSESLTVSDDILADFIRTLYPPDGPWDFAAIADDILGIVYEKFLGNIVIVKLGEADIEQKPEVRHANGVYYTPRFVVDTIIRRVVGPKIAGRSPMEVLDVRILDPACGSGSFLVAAFQYLIDHCIAAIAKTPSLATVAAPGKSRKKQKAIAFQDKKGQWQLAPDFKAKLLTSCLHGVDIDQQAVEVTVMSLYLKMLEGKLPPNWQRDWLDNQLLPTLDNNILCGNSLINSADFDRWVIATHGGLFPPDDDIRFRINRFDWDSRTRGFGWLLDSQAEKEAGRRGFDCIIGNPPYIRVQELNQWAPDECAFYKWRYKSAAKGNYDIYVVFVERCLSLLAPDGLLGYIMPHKFWQAKYGEGLRKIIADGKHLQSVIDFGDQQVFEGATTYTAIHVLGKASGPDTIDYVKFTELFDGVAQCAFIDADRDNVFPGMTRRHAQQLQPGSLPFHFAPSLCDGAGVPLSSIAHLAQGFKTGADGVFVVELIEVEDKIAVVRSEATGNTHKIEMDCLRPLVKSEHMKAFCILPTRLRLIFPYSRKGEQWQLLSPDEMESLFPKLWHGYLKPLRPVLAERERGRWDGDRFYRYSRPQNFEPLSQKKIINPDICEHPQMCWDSSGEYVFSGGAAGGVAIVPSSQVSPLLLTGILNSKYADAWIRQNGTPFRGGYLNCEIRFIKNLPIKLPETAAEKKLADCITESVRAIMDAQTTLRDGNLSDRERGSLERDVENDERRIDELVFRLYGVDGLPQE